MNIRRVTDPQDPLLAAFDALQQDVYFEPEHLIPAAYVARTLAQAPHSRPLQRQDALLVATGHNSQLLGATLFHYLPSAHSGFSSFLGVARLARGQGVARHLHQARWRTLQALSGGACTGLFIDVVSPVRLTPPQLAAEHAVGSDPAARRRAFAALGFGTVNLAYQQPVGGPDGGPVTHLDLLYFAPHRPPAVSTQQIAAALRAYWTPWLGAARAEQEAQRLVLLAGGPQVALLPAEQSPILAGVSQ